MKEEEEGRLYRVKRRRTSRHSAAVLPTSLKRIDSAHDGVIRVKFIASIQRDWQRKPG